jgi:hypothetical protein
MNNNSSNRRALRALLGALIGCVLALPAALAASGDGSLVGRLSAGDSGSLAGTEITARNPDTGFNRTVKVDADGNYRFARLPVGRYVLEARRDGAELGKLAEATVSLGNATTADIDLNAANIDVVEVVGSRIVTAVDVTSTETATNFTIEELQRLPVERDILSVALLAAGLTKGDDDLCLDGLCGVSFGGSSIAENAVYINGLNVTDFYNRVGASSVPYSFYKEFQVKTGGYSVEFGRTTGGVINAVTRSGTNEFDFGAEIVWEPNFLQAAGTDRYDPQGNPHIISQFDEWDRGSVNMYASGPIVKDKLFFFGLYEVRDYKPVNTSDSGNLLNNKQQDDAFWGAKLDWQISDRHLLEALAFSDENEEVNTSYDFDLAAGEPTTYANTAFLNSGGMNWALTYTGYLLEDLTMKVLYGENEREFARVSLNDIDCNRVRDLRLTVGQGDVGCTSSPNLTERLDDREAMRVDFEWAPGDHLVRFGFDQEINTSNHEQFYPGVDRLLYEVNTAMAGSTLENGAIMPAVPTSAYVRARRNEVDGAFETLNTAWYLEDNWSITPKLLLNAGLRLEGFDNRNSDGDSYIKIDDMLAPRLGFSWDLRGDKRTKLFGNAGRYFLPVANVINIKQAGGFLDERTYYVFNGFESFQYNGRTVQRPILGPQLGAVDNSQGDGTVRDLRGTVDADLDPVFQDEVILGFQSMIDDTWSWGVRGTYRMLNNAIDDINITSNGILCGVNPRGVGFVMGNPGEPLTVFTDTNCDSVNDAYVTIDTAVAGWSLRNDANVHFGETGYDRPVRKYRAFELMLDRAWDRRWSMNASYTLAYSRGNAEGPVNSDTNFSDTGRTEAFDNPWVNFGGYGNLPNDRRHQFKLRGVYGINHAWQFGATLAAQSGRPISAFGVGNPFDRTSQSVDSFFVCTANCTAPPSQRQYELHPRGSEGNLPWTFDLGANVSWSHSFPLADLQVRFSVYNLLNQERVLEVDEQLERPIGTRNGEYRLGAGYQAPRYALLSLKLDF